MSLNVPNINTPKYCKKQILNHSEVLFTVMDVVNKSKLYTFTGVYPKLPFNYGCFKPPLPVRFKRSRSLSTHTYDRFSGQDTQVTCFEYFYWWDWWCVLNILIHWSLVYRIPIQYQIKLFKQIVCTLNYLHNHNIAHLDLHQQNIIINSDNNVVIIDFSLSVLRFQYNRNLGRTLYVNRDLNPPLPKQEHKIKTTLNKLHLWSKTMFLTNLKSSNIASYFGENIFK